VEEGPPPQLINQLNSSPARAIAIKPRRERWVIEELQGLKRWEINQGGDGLDNLLFTFMG
jgi:hypothetical protein